MTSASRMPMGTYPKEEFNYEEQAHYAAKEFFAEASKGSLSGTHSILEGTNVLLYDYHSAFKTGEEKFLKASQFLNTINLGRIGLKTCLEFLDADNQPMTIMQIG